MEACTLFEWDALYPQISAHKNSRNAPCPCGSEKLNLIEQHCLVTQGKQIDHEHALGILLHASVI